MSATVMNSHGSSENNSTLYYLGTTCIKDISDPLAGNGDGSGGGTLDPGTGVHPPSDGGNGGVGTPPINQNPCGISVHNVPGQKPIQVNSFDNDPVDDGDGGFPPPTTQPKPPTNPCTVVTTPVIVPNRDIIDSLSLKYPCAKQLIAALPRLSTDLAKLIYQAFDSKDGSSITFFEGDPSYFTGSNALEDGHTIDYNIYLNPFVLTNSSNEYRLVTFYHEAIHAFLHLEHERLKTNFSSVYPMVNIVERPNFSQVVGADKYDYYISTSYNTKVVGKDHLTMAEYFITELKDAILAYNPSFPPERAVALAKAGIVTDDSTVFVNYNNMERDVTKGTSVGTKCTP